MSRLTNKIMKKLEEVIDPELQISIVDLGLIYDVTEKKGDVEVKMTLTSLGCPLFPIIEKDVREKVESINGVTRVYINLVFDPPWSMENMTERGKAMMGI